MEQISPEFSKNIKTQDPPAFIAHNPFEVFLVWFFLPQTSSIHPTRELISQKGSNEVESYNAEAHYQQEQS